MEVGELECPGEGEDQGDVFLGCGDVAGVVDGGGWA